MKKNKKSVLLIIMAWLVYCSSYLGRYSYNSNIIAIINHFDVSHASAGLVTTFFFFAYGIGQIVNGLLCKFYSKKWTIGIVLILSAIINFLVCFNIPFVYFKYLWLLNGFLHSFIWPILILTLAENLNQKEIKKSVVVMGTTVAVGTSLAYGLSSLYALFDGFKYSFLTAGIGMLIIGLCWIIFYSRFTKSLMVNENNKELEVETNKNQKNVSLHILLILGFMAIMAIVNNLVKDGLATWVPSIMQEKYHFSDSLSIFLTILLPILGMIGTIIAVLISEKIKSFFKLISIMFFISTICLLFVNLFFNTNYWFIVFCFFGLISLFMYGINNIITNMFPLYVRDKINSGLVAGVLDGCCYIGSTISSYGLGVIVDKFGWNVLFYFLFSICAIAFIVSFFMTIFKKDKILIK